MIFLLTYKIQYYTVKKIGNDYNTIKITSLLPPLPHKTIKKTDSDRSPLLMGLLTRTKKNPLITIYINAVTATLAHKIV